MKWQKAVQRNWVYKCTYELRPHALTGLHQILQLENMMISLVVRPGGMMHDVLSAKESISFAVHIDLEDKACLGRMKCQTGDIVLFDDAKPYKLHDQFQSGTLRHYHSQRESG